MPRTKSATSRRVFINAGCGVTDNKKLPPYLRDWRQVRVDIDPDTSPDVVSSITDLTALPDGKADAIWCAHCIEHLYAHEVPAALSEFRRVLRKSAFACIVVPDLQAIAQWIANDRLTETIYESAAGPVAAHDMIWGFGPALANGNTAMAHHCGFTPTSFLKTLTDAGFEEILLRRRSSLELVALAMREPSKQPGRSEALLAELGFQ